MIFILGGCYKWVWSVHTSANTVAFSTSVIENTVRDHFFVHIYMIVGSYCQVKYWLVWFEIVFIQLLQSFGQPHKELYYIAVHISSNMYMNTF